MSMNVVTLVGNLTRDPEIRSIGESSRIAEFGMALNRKRKGADGQMKEETSFVEIKCWGGTADLVNKYCKKGDRIGIVGRLQQDRWTDKDTGKNREKLYITAEDIEFLGGGQQEARQNEDSSEGDVPL